MELSDAITSRRTIKDFKPDAVPADVLDRALSAGLWAQNHKMTQPWRFTVLGPETHRCLAGVFADAQAISGGPGVRAEAEHKILSKPGVVAVRQVLASDDSTRKEDYAAIACAIQNIQLAAWAEGVGMQWSSGKIMRMPSVLDLLGINRDAEEIVAFLFFGFPAKIPTPAPRRALADMTTRLP